MLVATIYKKGDFMSKKHPGSPEMNSYQPTVPVPKHLPPENEPPHHERHELEHLLEEQKDSEQRFHHKHVTHDLDNKKPKL